MKNIFVSYNQADRERVRRIVRLFEERGWSVYWDRNTQPGDPWDRLLERCLDTAQCVVAVWSSASVESDWVRAEVRRAKAQNKVVPCRIDRDAEIPLEFSGVHAANLVGFPDTHDPTQQDNLLTRVAELIGKRPALSSLREAYLNRVLRENNQLALGGIDPKAAGERQASLELGAVYTALLTLSAQERETEGTGVEHSRALAARETRRRSALEAVNDHPRLVLKGDAGSGKSTFVRVLTACLAGEALGRSDVNLALLRAPLPEDDGTDQDTQQPWDQGPLLPVRVVLADLVENAHGDDHAQLDVWSLIAGQTGDFATELKPELRGMGGLVLFDGLDETGDARERAMQAILKFVDDFPRCRILVSSRTYAYEHGELAGFADVLLAPFSDGQIIRFVDRWYGHVAERRQDFDRETARGKAARLKEAVRANASLHELAQSPLLLTLMASLHAWRGTLPDQREELYQDAINLLLDWWEQRKLRLHAEGGVRVEQPSLTELLRVGPKKVLEVLAGLAHEAHAMQPERQRVASITRQRLVDKLLEASADPDIKPGRLIEHLRDRAGLLLPHGMASRSRTARSRSTWPHRTSRLGMIFRPTSRRWRGRTPTAGAKSRCSRARCTGGRPLSSGLSSRSCARTGRTTMPSQPATCGARSLPDRSCSKPWISRRSAPSIGASSTGSGRDCCAWCARRK